MKRILFAILLILALVSCSNEKYSEEITSTQENLTGIKISEGQLNENKEIVHNIFNFDKTEKKVKVTTICYDINNKIIGDNDTYEMVLPPESVSGWNPECPENTEEYRIDVKEIE